MAEAATRRRQRRRRRVLAAALLAFLAAAAAAAVVTVVVVLGGGAGDADTVRLADYEANTFGDVLIMRHAMAPGGGDPAGFALGNCSTQRNLGTEGIAQATEIGKRLASSTLTIGKVVYASQWCRCRDTATLIAAQLNNNSGYTVVEDEWGLNSFYQPERGGFTEEACMLRLGASILGRLKAIPVGERDGKLTLMVTHKVTVTAVTGVSASSGDIVAYDSQTHEAKRLEL